MITLDSMRRLRPLVIYLAPLLCIFVITLVLNLTNPLSAGPGSILVVFVLLYLLIFTALAAITYFLDTILRMIKPQKEFFNRRTYYVLSVIALTPVLFIALNTLGQLELLEIVLILLLVSLGCFYVLRRTVK